MKKSQIKIVIVGLGHQSKTDHLPVIQNNPNIELVGIVDPYVVEFQNVPVFQNIDSLDSSGLEYDSVLVSIPHNLHFKIVSDFVKRGKHVLKEKPAALSSIDLNKLYELSKENNVHIMVNAQRRLKDHYQKAKQFISQLGQIFLIEGKYCIYVPNPEEGWRGDAAIAGGGCIIDMGYHLIDLITYYFGLPDSISALSSMKAIPSVDYSAEDTAVIHFKYDNPLIEANGSLLISRFCGPKDEFVRVVGSDGILEITKQSLVLKSNSGEIVSVIEGNKSVNPIDHFVDVLINDSDSLLDLKSHLSNTVFIEKCYESIKYKKSINLNN